MLAPALELRDGRQRWRYRKQRGWLCAPSMGATGVEEEVEDVPPLAAKSGEDSEDTFHESATERGGRTEADLAKDDRVPDRLLSAGAYFRAIPSAPGSWPS